MTGAPAPTPKKPDDEIRVGDACEDCFRKHQDFEPSFGWVEVTYVQGWDRRHRLCQRCGWKFLGQGRAKTHPLPRGRKKKADDPQTELLGEA